MFQKTTKALGALAVGVLAGAGLIVPDGTLPASAAPTYTKIDQANMSVVDVSSVEEKEEGTNGPANLVLDGDPATYWHTKWQPVKDPLPHHLTIKLGKEPVTLGRVALTPRQSSNGSGRVADYSIQTSLDETCKAGFAEVATGKVAAGENPTAVLPIDFKATEARCVKVVYAAAWGGDNSPETAATLAEFNAFTVSEGGPDVPVDPPVKPEIQVPEGAVTLTDGGLTVRLHPAFPQVVDYQLSGKQLAGKYGQPLSQITIDEVAFDVSVQAPAVAGNTATYQLQVSGLDVGLTVAVSLEGGTLTWKITEVRDPASKVHRIAVPGLDLLTVTGADSGSIMAASLGVSRNRQADNTLNVASAREGTTNGYLVAAHDANLAAGFMSNSTSDNTSTGPRGGSGTRWQAVVKKIGPAPVGAISPGPWVYRGSTSHQGLGPDEAPFAQVKIVGDANSDGAIDWQDSAIATRELRPATSGQDAVKNKVITRIPFNIVSQATHPFLRTLDDTKRVALETDNLGQQVLLKGYQAEGHDAAHPDYAGHYNTRAGGLEDLKKLAEEAAKWNANLGVHVNVTESYSEARAFSEELLRMPPQKAWGWMNQAYYIDSAKDLGTTNVLKRFQQFRNEAPANLNWLYIDVYYPDGWEGQRLGRELQKQGWIVGSEWSDKFPDMSVWSHWANDENYGGQDNKGLNSQLIRFVENSYRDTFNPHPILSNANVSEFEGWAGNVNHQPFIKTIWERNLPVKFLQQSNIMRWGAKEITFANGTVASSEVASIDGRTVPTNRKFVYDGATVYDQGAYLLPWTDGAKRLYHWNPAGGSSTWVLTEAWKGQSALALFKLTDTGRVKVRDVAVTGGKVTLEAEAGTAYVLYPAAAVPDAKNPNWGQGSQIADPGFFSGTLEAYTVSGAATIEKSERDNYLAVLGAGESAISQQLNLPKGSYSAWAWVEVERGKTRGVKVSVSGEGVKPAGYQGVIEGVPATEISASTALNSTASDEKLRTYFQRVRVTFESSGAPVTFQIAAAGGDAKVRVDDLRVVPFTPGKDPKPTEKTVFFDDFENVDTGYWPFVTGKDNAGGDARTQLAERHEPYSQKGWWGVVGDRVVEGGKVNDNVLAGNWSLMAHEENRGLILRTIPSSIQFKAGHKYRISMDHQAGYAGKYQLVLAYDRVAEGAPTSTVVSRIPIGEVRETALLSHEFVAGSCGQYWFGFEKLAGGAQSDLVVDNLRIEDLGESPEVPGCAEASLQAPGSVSAGEPFTLTSEVRFFEAGTVSEVEHQVSAPEGWSVVKAEGGSQTAQAWKVTAPKDTTSGELQLTVTYKADGAARSVASSKTIKVQKPLAGGVNYLSDLPFSGEPTNGWGPVERDQSNGEQNEGDGTPLTIAGKVYKKGLGTHAPSSVSFELAGKCQRFKAVVGVNDTQARGSVTFEVKGDNKSLGGPTSTLRHGQSQELDVDVTGVKVLTLVVGNGGDGSGNDHANWADARVECAGEPELPPGVSGTVTYTGAGSALITPVLLRVYDTAGSEVARQYVSGGEKYHFKLAAGTYRVKATAYRPYRLVGERETTLTVPSGPGVAHNWEITLR